MRALFRQFSFPGGIPSHAAPETPGSIHEGGELGYALAHAYGAAFDNPDLLVACVVGDGEAETGPLAASWHSNKFLNPVHDGAVLPILHLNGYKIANPTVLARIPERRARLRCSRATATGRCSSSGDEPARVHQQLAATLDEALDEIAAHPGGRAGDGVTRAAALADDRAAHAEGLDRARGCRRRCRSRAPGAPTRCRWPRLARQPRAPGAARAVDAQLPARGAVRRRRPRCGPSSPALAPEGDAADGREPARQRRPAAARPRPARLPRLRGRRRRRPGATTAEATRVLGGFLRDVMRAQPDERFRLFGPDETASNRLQAVFEATDRVWTAEILPADDHLAPDGRVMEVLSEHLCQGWLEGYLLTGRHGLFNCYEAFIHIVDSMFNQHAKWLKVTRDIPWRRPIASLNYLLTSHVWRQDHNGFSHQDPGFIDHVVNKKAEVIRVYLPPDANCLLSVADHCLRSRHYVNVIVAGKQPSADWLSMDEAIVHCTRGHRHLGLGEQRRGGEPDVVLACCRRHPDARDAGRGRPAAPAPARAEGAGRQRGRPDAAAAGDRAPARPVGRRVRRAVHDRPAGHLRLPRLPVAHPPAHLPAHNHANLHVRGYKEEGTTTTPFDMVMLNDLDRFHLVDGRDRPGAGPRPRGR